MKAFISHALGGDDEPLANALKEDLGEAGITGYLAEKTQRYDLPISDKIKQEIDESNWLVAVITERSHASASVHEEIGYALRRGIRVALMVEEGVEAAGVFTYGREYARFSVPKFGEHSRRMATFIADSPRQQPPRPAIRDATKRFLQGRNVLSANPDNFAANEHYRHLFSPVPDDTKKPAALFTACPNDLVGNADVAAPEFAEWVEATASVEAGSRQVRVPGLEPHVDTGMLLAIDQSPRAPPGRNILTYRVFQSNGLFEFGTSRFFFDRNGRGNMEMHLCYTVGEFWSFLAQARLFYRKTGLDSPFTAFVSVRNSDRLRPGNYGDEALRPTAPLGRCVPPAGARGGSLPRPGRCRNCPAPPAARTIPAAAGRPARAAPCPARAAPPRGKAVARRARADGRGLYAGSGAGLPGGPAPAAAPPTPAPHGGQRVAH